MGGIDWCLGSARSLACGPSQVAGNDRAQPVSAAGPGERARPADGGDQRRQQL